MAMTDQYALYSTDSNSARTIVNRCVLLTLMGMMTSALVPAVAVAAAAILVAATARVVVAVVV
jgi:hypothetical protein